MRFSFFHAADLHLGAASEGVMRGAPDRVRAAVEESTYRAFENLIADAERERPAFVLFPGDLYNSADQNLRARLGFRHGIDRLDALGIKSVVIRGNHDPLTGTDVLPLPESCHVFPVRPDEPLTLFLDGQPIARVYGESYPTARVAKNLAAKYPKVDKADGLLNIAMLHGNLLGEKSLGGGERNPGDYAPFRIEDLSEGGYDYWALGHVHTHRILASGTSWAVYTGSLQGVSPRERGAHGYVEVLVDDHRVDTVRFREADVLRWAETSVDISGAQNLDEVAERIDATVQALASESETRPVVARLSLTGNSDLDSALREDGFSVMLERLRDSYAGYEPFVWIESWRIETRPEIDWAALRASHSVQGFLLGLPDDSEFIESLPAKLKAAAGRSKLDLPEDSDFDALLRRAAERAVGMLNLEVGA